MPKPADIRLALACLNRAVAVGADHAGVALLIVRLVNHRAVALHRGVLAAEQLLDQWEQRIAGLLRPSDSLLRIGDADYAVIAGKISHEGQVTLAAQKLLRATDEPVRIGEFEVHVRQVVGAAIFPQHARDAEQLLDAAVQALEQCTTEHQAYQVRGQAPAPEAKRAWRIEQLLDRAFERGELHLCYQPKMNIADDALEGAEVLSRWDSPELGAVPPDEFILLAEQCGLIQRLTWTALNSALEQAARWRARGKHVPMAVNFSATCLRDNDLLERMRRALTIWAAPRGLVTLEITEGIMMEHVGPTFELLGRLRAEGLRISIDDFGTGYSSFAYFKQLPADEIKIDRSFVRGMVASAADRHIVQTITELAHRFGMKVVAEGVEDAETLGELRRIGCDTAQGYLYSRPVRAEQFAAKYIDPAGAPGTTALAASG